MFVAEQIHTRINGGGSLPRPNDFLILFSRRDVVLASGPDTCFPRFTDAVPLLPPDVAPLVIGSLDGILCYGAELAELPDELPRGLIKSPSRFLLANASEDIWNALCRTRELIFWRNRHRYCGVCRTPLIPSDHDLALSCPVCKNLYYPQIAPAVIVAVSRDNGRELLLAHNRNFDPEVYSLIAGFVESGETVEQAAAREILEETGIRVRNLTYLTSQTWPFPNSLMLAFTAEYESGDAKPDGEELTDLGWFSAKKIPVLPMQGSIARRVIGRFFGIDAGR